ncbi:uncharacterized protein LOC132736128 isoform X2 [Ruditapes philippinarum]|uniref:uncharacterized protein LOC132736128 isoform X2 n=1 Tax=Ruditapes philippinarum TaxID=129788 RepID=UPI00295B3CAA|nr:uncharacterized protein LOC132736128 isoform X2 [Ruditapes philippinarum]
METFAIRYFLHIFLCGFCAAIDLTADLKYLSEMLPGYYSNNGRHSKHFRHSFERPLSSQDTPAEALTTIPLTAVYRPVDVTFLPDCFNVYVEQTLYGKQRPHRQWLYSFSKDERTRSIKLKVYNFIDKSLVEKISKNPRSVKYLNARDVSTRSECDMFWRRLGETFVGTTSRQCVAMVDGKQVRISVMTTLTQKSLQIDEGWYNAVDGSKVIELEGPIFMTKVETISENPHPGTGYEREDQQKHEEVALLQQDARTRHKKQNSRFDKNRIPEGKRPRENPRKQLYISSNDVPTSNYRHNGPKTSPLLTNAIEKAGFDPYNYKRKNGGDTGYRRQTTSPSKPTEEKSTWNLQTYEGVIDALLTGHKVYFTAHTKNCFHEHARKREQTTFGDYVDVFEIQKDFSIKQPNKLLQFSLKRMQHTKRRGFKEIIREVTVHRNSTVHILTVILNEDGNIDRNSYAECNLYNQDTGKGDVKFYLDPYRSVSKVTKLRNLRTNLQQGKMIRMTTELDKCSGGQSDFITVGGEFRGYDLGRNSKTVDVTLSTTKLIPQPGGDLSVEEHFTIFRFPKHGEITVTRHRKHVTSLVQNVSIVNGFQKYKCEIDPNSSTKTVHLFNS